jgi:thymidylate synthase ThyX
MQNKFSQKIRFGEKEEVGFVNLKDLRLRLVSGPPDNFRESAYRKIRATWGDLPVIVSDDALPKDEVANTFMELLSGKVLPNALESIQFSFLIENLPYVEVTHLLRHRTIFGLHAQCTGDRDLRTDSYYIPNSFSANDKVSELYHRYIKLVRESVKLYADMVDSKEISIMDARYVLPRSAVYFYFFSFNLKDLIMFIRQRRCTMIQPEVDNQFAHLVYNEVVKIVPEIAKVLSVECDGSCYYVNSQDEHNTRLYEPDPVHLEILKKKGRPVPDSVYHKTRKEMGSSYGR